LHVEAKTLHEPLQHTASSEQAPPAGLHASQVPAVHKRLQHSSGLSHAVPADRQSSQTPPGVQCVVQQSASVVHAPPSATQHTL